MSHRNNIEIYLTKFLNCKTYSLVVDAAKCTHILQQVNYNIIIYILSWSVNKFKCYNGKFLVNCGKICIL